VSPAEVRLLQHLTDALGGNRLYFTLPHGSCWTPDKVIYILRSMLFLNSLKII
jgi:hypothetical protein